MRSEKDFFVGIFSFEFDSLLISHIDLYSSIFPENFQSFEVASLESSNLASVKVWKLLL